MKKQHLRIKDLPEFKRPREKLEKTNINFLTNSELLSILLGSGVKGINVKKVAENLLNKFGYNLFNANIKDLTEIKGIGKVKAEQIVSAFELAKRFIIKDQSKITIHNSNDAFSLCKELTNKRQEHLVVLYLDPLNQLIKKEIISIGTVNSSLVHPREIFAPAYINNATAVIIVHNHPSAGGDCNPTIEDRKVTEKLLRAEEISGIKVIDHIIISKKGYFSLVDSYNQDNKVNYFKSGYEQISLSEYYPFFQNKKYLETSQKKYKDSSFNFKNIRQTDGIHGLHVYPAVMAYPIADYLIDTYSKEDDIVLDPFMGAGTTLVEANLKKRYSYGIDINPLAEFITKVKLTPLEPSILKNELENILKNVNILESYIPKVKNINLWFKGYVIDELGKLRHAISQIENNDIKDFFKISFSETIRAVSNCRNGFKLHRYSEKDLEKHNPKVKESFFKKSIDNIYRLNSIKDKLSEKHWFKIIKHISEIKDKEIDLIVTSPPYGDSKTTVAYGQFSRFSLEWLGLENINVDRESLGGRIIKDPVYDVYSESLFNTLDKISIQSKKRAKEVFAFFYDLNKYLKEFARVVKPNGFMCVVIGNRTVKGFQIPTDEIIVELCRNNFLHHKTIIREIPNKRMPAKNSPTNIVGQTVSTMLEEFIIIFERK
ncbi:MAG: DNA repair protein RadC [Candidatus Cloacimonetes bacterium]|nr:DNA repair protein RadC [Candidatus Cloacimonadota bacterium]